MTQVMTKLGEKVVHFPLSIIHFSVHIFTLETAKEFQIYEAWVRSHPQGSLWQSHTYKRYMEACGKEVRVYVATKNQESRIKNQDDEILASALVVIDRTAGGFSTWEIPRGPLWSDELPAMSCEPVQVLMDAIIRDAMEQRSICLYLSPPLPIQLKAPAFAKATAGKQSSKLKASPRHVHCEATRMIDLTQPEETIFAQMHPKGRYNIAVARRHGVTVREGSASDADAFYSLLRETARRDKFTVSQKSHYTRFLDCIGDSFILMAEHAQRPIAGLIGVIWPATGLPTEAQPIVDTKQPSFAKASEGNLRCAKVGIYYYGASSYDDRQLMAPYLLQWEAMRYCKAKGCSSYDLMGIEHEKKLQATSYKLQAVHPWQGVSEFKRKFGGTVITYPPEQMIILRPFAYKALQLKRKLFG